MAAQPCQPTNTRSGPWPLSFFPSLSPTPAHFLRARPSPHTASLSHPCAAQLSTRPSRAPQRPASPARHARLPQPTRPASPAPRAPRPPDLPAPPVGAASTPQPAHRAPADEDGPRVSPLSPPSLPRSAQPRPGSPASSPGSLSRRNLRSASFLTPAAPPCAPSPPRRPPESPKPRRRASGVGAELPCAPGKHLRPSIPRRRWRSYPPDPSAGFTARAHDAPRDQGDRNCTPTPAPRPPHPSRRRASPATSFRVTTRRLQAR